jgi:hypothetical protein
MIENEVEIMKKGADEMLDIRIAVLLARAKGVSQDSAEGEV